MTETDQIASKIIADAVMAVPMAERSKLARQLTIYALATVVTLDGERAATEFAYRAADAAVGVA